MFLKDLFIIIKFIKKKIKRKININKLKKFKYLIKIIKIIVFECNQCNL